MSEREESCETCRFYRPGAVDGDSWSTEDERIENEGWCHRHAPAPRTYDAVREDECVAEGDDWPLLAPYWPQVKASDWCGEWRCAHVIEERDFGAWGNKLPICSRCGLGNPFKGTVLDEFIRPTPSSSDSRETAPQASD